MPREGARLGAEEGIALATTIMLLLVISLVAAVGSTVVISSLSETDRDRSSARAFAAADAAIDVTTWRMNKLLVSNDVQSVGDLGTGILATVGCLSVLDDAITVEVATAGQQYCGESAVENIGSGIVGRCRVETNVDLPTDAGGLVGGLVGRNVVCWAEDENGGVIRRLMTRVELDVQASNLPGVVATPTGLWARTGWVECTAEAPPASDPESGCPEIS